MKITPAPAQPRNRLLSLLPPAEYQRLMPRLQAVTLPVKHVVYKTHAPIDYVYFPSIGVVSAMTVMEDGDAIEVATIGNEGMTGLTAFIGGVSSPNEVMVQVQGDGVRMSVEVLKEEVSKDGLLRRILVHYHTAYATQVSYSVACNGLHKVEQRCLPLASDDGGSCGVQPASADSRVPGDHAWRPAFQRDGRSSTASGTGLDRKRSRRNQDHRPARSGSHCLRMLPSH